MAVACLEPKFFHRCIEVLGLDATWRDRQYDPRAWDELRSVFTDRFRAHTQQEWVDIVDGSDACVMPVLTMHEAARHPHMAARGVFMEHEGMVVPAPAPRFSTPTIPS